ncbi:MAG TPA: zinc-binding dehydrogenase [Rubrobacteraceae bacterium]|nr:zinc-binding dehydrogenase [Rubrobacteraceae bacterium]
MKAVRYHGPGQPFRMEEVDRREPDTGEVLVRVAASGMCHTELHFKDGLLDLGVTPVTMGHEVVGRIESVGDRVSRERVGERVIVYYYLGCGECAYCRVGDEQLCPNLRAEYGFISDGGYAEYVTVPSRNAVLLPGTIPDTEAAPIGCGVTTAVHASKLSGLRWGEWVLVYGVGGVGFGLVQLAHAAGARVIAVGRSAAKLEKALELGAEFAVSAAEGSVAGRVSEITGGAGVDVVFECVGTEESMKEASASLGRRGRLVFIGYSPDTFTVHPIQLVVFEQSVMGSVGATLDDLYEAVSLVERGVVSTIVDRTLPLEQFEMGLDALERGELIGRAVLMPGA